MVSSLTDWKSISNSHLSPAERVKDEIRITLSHLETTYPSWSKSNDARCSWFTGAKKIIQTSQLCYLFIRDHLTEAEWWTRRATQFKEDEISEHIREYDIFVRYGFSNVLFTITEESFRSIVRAIDPTACDGGRGDFLRVCKYLLNAAKKEEYAHIFDFHRNIRNAIHTNGVFRPRREIDRSFILWGKQFSFIVGQKINFQSYELLLRLVAQYNQVILEIVETPDLSKIPHVDRFQW